MYKNIAPLYKTLFSSTRDYKQKKVRGKKKIAINKDIRKGYKKGI